MTRNQISKATILLIAGIVFTLMAKQGILFFVTIIAYVLLWFVPPPQIVLNWERPRSVDQMWRTASIKYEPSMFLKGVALLAALLRWAATAAQYIAIVWPFLTMTFNYFF